MPHRVFVATLNVCCRQDDNLIDKNVVAMLYQLEPPVLGYGSG